MSTPESSKKRMGITLGGGLVIAGIVIALFVSILLGVIVALIGLIAFGGFVRGKWY
jgi:ABC-type microcin C transport system permease subunit YejE